MGHLWLDKVISPEEFREQAVHAMIPALCHYCGLKAQSPWEWLSLIDSGIVSQSLKENESSRSPATSEKVSVIVCTRNRPNALKECIDQLFRSEDQDFELIIVDNASESDDTRRVASLYPSVKYVREDRKGLDIARNTGIANASCNIIAFTDDDVLVDHSWLSELKKSFDSPQTMAVTGLVIPHQLQSKAQYIFEHDWSFNKGYVPKTFDRAYFQRHLAEGVPVWDIGAGANMAFRKEIFMPVILILN